MTLARFTPSMMSSTSTRTRRSTAMRSLVVLFVMSVLPVVQPRAFDYCKDECNRFNGGLGTCQEDGTCACAPGWTGEGCELPNPGISKEKRRDDQYAYSYVVSPAAEIQVSDVVFDPSKKVLFVSAYDANTGAEVVYEADPLNPATYTSGGFTSRGWRSSGPNRADPNTKQPTPLTPTSGYCGAAVGIQTEPGCAAVTHARANGHADAATSGGWYSVFRGLALDTSGSITGVYGVHNMHKSAAGDPAFAFKIVKYLGTDCSSAAWDDCVIGSDNNRDPSHAYSGNGIIDAMASNEATGHVVYKVSNADGASQATIGLLSPTLTVEAETPLVADLLSGKCAACATSYDALKFETATYALSGADAFVIFAGAAKVEADGTSYPALFKVPAGRDDFVAANGHGVEMYLDATAVKVTSACEGVVDAKQGRFTTFTIVTKHGSFGYAGTSGRDENCVGCEHRSACVFVFPLNFSEGDSPSAMIALNGGEGGLDEKDVWAATIEPDAADADAGFMYLAVGPKSNTAFGRIVKVEIGGVDVAAGCVSGCFKRVGTFKEIVPFGGLAYVADLKGIVSLSRGDSSTTYTKYSTASITSISPQFVSSTTTGTLVTIHGTGFYTPANDDPTHKTHTVSCRFGHASVVDANFQTTGWVPATVVSSTELTCEVPSAANTISTSTTHAEVQISFDGFPVDGDSTFYWQRSLWNNDKAIVFYYDPPNLLQLETTGHDMPNDGVETDFNAKILFTGEDPDLNPATLKIYGGKFIDSDGSLAGSVQRLTCRYNGDSSSDLPGTYISQTLMECPLCVVSNATGRNRCGTHGQVNSPQYIPFAWLAGGTPKPDVDVSISMNGVDFHSSGTVVLSAYGPPHGLAVTHDRDPSYAYQATAESDGTLLLYDDQVVDLIDVLGTKVIDDMGAGGTRGFKITASVNATASTGSSASTLQVTAATSTQTTVNGSATFHVAFDFVPIRGDYTIDFSGEDCTNGEPCTPLSAIASLAVAIRPGKAVGLHVKPGSAGAYATSDGFPYDVIARNSTQSVQLGYIIVGTIDAGGNGLETLDTVSHTVVATVVSTEVDSNGVHVPRPTGAFLGGTTSKDSSAGFVKFLDLSLDSAAPSGARVPGAGTDVTYGDASLGDHGTDVKYIVQFSTTFDSNVAYTHTVVKLSLGKAVYLKVNGTYGTISMDATEARVQIPQSVEIGAYDGGNNWVRTNYTEGVTVSASSPSDPALVLEGTLEALVGNDTGTWKFADPSNPIYAVSPLIGEYTLRFSALGFDSVDQIISVTLGYRGYQLAANLPADFGPFPAASLVNFDNFTVRVLDGGGNFMGTSDRFAVSDAHTVARQIKFTSNTLQLSGTTTVYTAGDGEAPAVDLSCIEPKAGNHTIFLTEEDAIVNGASVGSAINGSFVVTIIVGQPAKLQIYGSPADLVSVSLGSNMLAEEVGFYQNDALTPLDNFTIHAVDGGGNRITSFSNYYEYSTEVLSDVNSSQTSVLLSASSPTSDTVVQVAPLLIDFVTQSLGVDLLTYENVTHYTLIDATHETTFSNTLTYRTTRIDRSDMTITASLNDTSREPYSFVVGNNSTLNRRAILAADASYYRSGSLTQITSTGEANFTGLHLAKPAEGTYELKFSSSDVSFQPTTMLIHVVTGRSQVLALPVPCEVVTGPSNYPECVTSSACTCNHYPTRLATPINTLELHVLDAGFNPVFGNDTIHIYNRTDRDVKIASDLGDLKLCREINSTACECNAAGFRLPPNDCEEVFEFSVLTVNGTASISGLRVMAPPKSDQYKILFTSEGLFDLRYGLIFSEGSSYGLQLVVPTSFPAPANSRETFQSAYVTAITSMQLYPTSTEVQVIMVDGGGNYIADKELTGRIVYASCATATLAPYPQAIGQGGSYYAVTCRKGFCPDGEEPGIARFRNLQLLSPSAGVHVIEFTGKDMFVGVNYTITVLVGDPVKLKVVTFAQTTYQALPLVELSTTEVAVVDAGENLVGTANPLTRLVTAEIAGPRHTFITSNGENTGIILKNFGSYNFESLVLDAPATGNYTLTFTASGLLNATQAFSIMSGPSARLYIPITFSLSPTDTIIPTLSYTSLKTTTLDRVVVLILDGGLNYIYDASRNVSVTVNNNGNLTYTVQNSSMGYVLFDDITLHNPAVGLYTLSFESTGLQDITMDISITPGYSAILDTCRSNANLVRNVSSGLCVEEANYTSAALVTLRDFTVDVLDAGRVFVGSNWNNERRDVHVHVTKFEGVDGSVVRYSSDLSLPNPINVTKVVRDGKASPSVTLSHPKAGTYSLLLTSFCPFKYCGNAIYPTMEEDTLQVKIIPGTPYDLRFHVAPPAVNENDFRVNPMPVIHVFDVADNICTETVSTMTASLSPSAESMYGYAVALVDGAANFTSLRFVSERGKPYRLVFELSDFNLRLEHSPFTLRACEEVKPNSFSDSNGLCHCLPGFTEDLHTFDNVAGSGSVELLENHNIANFSLYTPVVYKEGNWVEALNPYGICAPCANGYYKPETGSQACTKCPENFDTNRTNGMLSPPYKSTSGLVLPGHLGRINKEQCHCVAEGVGWSYYRDVSGGEAYKCTKCPEGGNCTGVGVEGSGPLLGYWRASLETTKYTACPNPIACLGGVDSTCMGDPANNTGYSGTLCAICLPDFAHPTVNGRFPPTCVGCGDPGINVALFFFQWFAIVFVILGLAKLNARRGSEAVCLFKAFWTYMQTVYLAKELDMNWPNVAAGYLTFLEKISSVNLQSSATQCLFAWDYYGATAFYVMLPIMFAVASMIYYSFFKFIDESKGAISTIARRFGAKTDVESDDDEDTPRQSPIINAADLRTKKRVEAMDNATFEKSWESKAIDEVLMMGVIVLWYLYPTIVQYLVGLMRCRTLDSGGEVYLIADLSLKCSEPIHAFWMFLLFVFIIVYVIGIPWGLHILLRYEGKNWTTHQMRFRVGFLYKGHDLSDRWWWEAVTFARKAVITCIVVLCSDVTRMGSYVVVWVLEACFILHFYASPYANERMHRIEWWGLLAAIATYNIGILYQDGSGGWWMRILLTLVLYLVNAGMWVLFIKGVVKEISGEGQKLYLARAKHDIQLEDDIAEEFAQRRNKLKNEEEEAERREQMKKVAGTSLAFADDAWLENLNESSAMEVKAEHKKLSKNLEGMREAWAERQKKNKARKYTVEEAHRNVESSPSARWQQRKEQRKRESRTDTILRDSAGDREPENRDSPSSRWRARQAASARPGSGAGNSRPRSQGGGQGESSLRETWRQKMEARRAERERK